MLQSAQPGKLAIPVNSLGSESKRPQPKAGRDTEVSRHWRVSWRKPSRAFTAPSPLTPQWLPDLELHRKFSPNFGKRLESCKVLATHACHRSSEVLSSSPRSLVERWGRGHAKSRGVVV